MASIQDIQTSLATIKSNNVALAEDVAAVKAIEVTQVASIAALTTEVADLKAKLGDVSPVSQSEVEAIAAELASALDSQAALKAELASLKTA